MQIILLERVENLGGLGEEVSVKNGFARNFLLPKGKALIANAQNRARFEAEREAIEKRNAEARDAATSAGIGGAGAAHPAAAPQLPPGAAAGGGASAAAASFGTVRPVAKKRPAAERLLDRYAEELRRACQEQGWGDSQKTSPTLSQKIKMIIILLILQVKTHFKCNKKYIHCNVFVVCVKIL